jgi:hypothetical protein
MNAMTDACVPGPISPWQAEGAPPAHSSVWSMCTDSDGRSAYEISRSTCVSSSPLVVLCSTLTGHD